MTEYDFRNAWTVGEFALLSREGCTSLGQVLGVSVHRVGRQYLPAEAQWGGDDLLCSLDRTAWAWENARRQAFARLTDQASQLGADAVVGVRLRRGEGDWGAGTIDYVVSGTAIRGGVPSLSAGPALSGLSGQEYVKLARAGWAPVGLLAATTVFFVSVSTRTRWVQRFSVARNQELTDHTRGFAAARDSAVARLRDQALAVDAGGIVGVQLEHRLSQERFRVATNQGRQRTGLSASTIAIGAEVPSAGRDKRDGLLITMHAMGTAIRRDPRIHKTDEVKTTLQMEAR